MTKQISKKFIENDAVDGEKIRLLENQAIRVGEIELIKLVNGLACGPQGSLASEAQVSEISNKLTVLEKRKFTITEETAVHLYLDFLAVEKTLSVQVGRLVAHEGDDFTTANVGNLTRITWTGNLAEGEEKIEPGDIVHVTAHKIADEGTALSIIAANEKTENEIALLESGQISNETKLLEIESQIFQVNENQTQVIRENEKAIQDARQEFQAKIEEISQKSAIAATHVSEIQSDLLNTVKNHIIEIAFQNGQNQTEIKVPTFQKAFESKFLVRRSTDTVSLVERGTVMIVKELSGGYRISVRSALDDSKVNFSTNNSGALLFEAQPIEGESHQGEITLTIME